MVRSGFRLAVTAVVAVALAGCSSSPTPAPSASKAPGASSSPASPTSGAAHQLAARGTEAPIGSIPWSQVGPGWMLATWSPVEGSKDPGNQEPGKPRWQDATTTLYLVDPQGGRYAITTFPPPGDQGSSPDLVDWSGDGGRALLYDRGSEDGTATEIDLHTGKQTSFTVAHGWDIVPRYSRPKGAAVLLLKSEDIDSAAALTRVDLAGKPQLTYPVDKLGSKFNAEYLSTPDGTQLVMATKTGLALMGNDGSVGKPLPVAGAGTCTPTRWWNTESTIVLARCFGEDSSQRLWLVPTNGAAPTALTASGGDQTNGDLGDENAWKLPQGTFVQATGACGFRYLAKLNGDGTTTQVKVPDVDENDSVLVLGLNGDHLSLHGTASCGTGEVLVDYDPANNTSTVLLGPPLNGGGVITALPYPGSN